MSKGIQVAGGATLIALLVGWYAATNLEAGASFVYYESLEEFLDSSTALESRHARVHGYVALGSIERNVAEQNVRFAVQSEPPHAATRGNATALPVLFASLETPDLFKDGAEVVLEGRLLNGAGGGAHFRADKLLAKCPSKFEAEEIEGQETASASRG